ncbi:MAG: aminodeoxychorismate/anthranilate synthase component II [Planctomycetaceae bacterium]
MILLIDNYDSFVHNLARYFRELGRETLVVRNDAITPDGVIDGEYNAIVLSPGPCTPAETGVCLPLLKSLPRHVPVLGVCLGHQAIAVAFGGHVERVAPVHGTPSLVRHAGQGLFRDLPDRFPAGRYHSLAVSLPLPEPLQVDAVTDEGVVMALSHRDRPIFGVQFHPESVLTAHGHRILSNFLEITERRQPADSTRSDHPVGTL